MIPGSTQFSRGRWLLKGTCFAWAVLALACVDVNVVGAVLSGGQEATAPAEDSATGDALPLIAPQVRQGRLTQTVNDPPVVQMLVPGFTVRELPLDLPNLNNVRYRSDGKLVALAYNGNIYLLTDTDGDGLEDASQMYWENQGRLRGPIGIALTPPGFAHGDGLFVASKGKLSLIVDRDGDDQADEEVIVADGWQEIPQSVDAIGVALAPDGSVYFGLGTANYANGYLLDEAGQAHYDLKSERGTVLRVAPDLQSRRVICTGVRFPVAMAFNRDGDLFCTDQEGATWLPNGNPHDELLHIEPGRHYGFPPRHPRHLPDVIDEPSVVDFRPQHQSTCGLYFNGSADGTPVFGPSWWEGNALVCGESRGKIFRSQLVKTSAGYLSRTETIACLGMLTVDCCVSPSGDLIVACHSGPPDWGTGPEGRGKLFNITYRDRQFPQPVAAWSSGPQEVRIAFDRPLDPLSLKDLTRRVRVEYGPYVHPGDRLEVLRPPYAVVERQLATPRFDLPVYSAQLSADARTILVATAPQSESVPYAVTLDEVAGSAQSAVAGSVRQVAAIDILYDLHGVMGHWTSDEHDATWSGWLPHLDLSAARELTQGSAEHDGLWLLLSQPGRLVLQTQINLTDMLRPAVQPGSELDYEPPPEVVTVLLRSSQSLELQTAADVATIAGKENPHETELIARPRQGTLVPLRIELQTGDRFPDLEVAFVTNEDDRRRVVQPGRLLVPWARADSGNVPLADSQPDPRLREGNWHRGRELFFGEQLGCAKCHRLGQEGGRIGPDLGNLPHRDYASVVRDILKPNDAMNPDYLGFNVALTDGRTFSGVILSSDERRIVLGDATGVETEIARNDIEQLSPSPVSTMPNNLGELMSDGQLLDLMTFLLTAEAPPQSEP